MTAPEQTRRLILIAIWATTSPCPGPPSRHAHAHVTIWWQRKRGPCTVTMADMVRVSQN